MIKFFAHLTGTVRCHKVLCSCYTGQALCLGQIHDFSMPLEFCRVDSEDTSIFNQQSNTVTESALQERFIIRATVFDFSRHTKNACQNYYVFIVFQFICGENAAK